MRRTERTTAIRFSIFNQPKLSFFVFLPPLPPPRLLLLFFPGLLDCGMAGSGDAPSAVTKLLATDGDGG